MFQRRDCCVTSSPPTPRASGEGGGSGPRRGHSAHIHTMTPRRTHTHNDILNVFILVEVFLERKWAFRSQSLLRFFMHMKTDFPLLSFYLKLFINNFFRMATLIYTPMNLRRAKYSYHIYPGAPNCIECLKLCIP